jgi:predicted ABC-type ATPase
LPRSQMVVVAGPPGSGKTTRFPLAEFGLDSFNADTRAAQLNAGSFRGISKEIRSQVNLEFQRWILDHIAAGKSFAIETTLRSDITFEQAKLAREHGFETSMYFVTTGDVEESIRRIKARAYRGGHSASEGVVRDIYEKSMRNLVTAMDYESGIDYVDIYDNRANLADQVGVEPLMSVRNGQVTYLAEDVPQWLDELLYDTRFEIDDRRELLEPERDQDTGSDLARDPDRDPSDFDR